MDTAYAFMASHHSNKVVRFELKYADAALQNIETKSGLRMSEIPNVRTFWLSEDEANRAITKTTIKG